MPDFSGATIKYTDQAYDPDEARDILMSLLGNPTGTLTVEDAPDAT